MLHDAHVFLGWYAFQDIFVLFPIRLGIAKPNKDTDVAGEAGTNDTLLGPDRCDTLFERLSAAWTVDPPMTPKWHILQWKAVIVHRWRS